MVWCWSAHGSRFDQGATCWTLLQIDEPEARTPRSLACRFSICGGSVPGSSSKGYHQLSADEFASLVSFIWLRFDRFSIIRKQVRWIFFANLTLPYLQRGKISTIYSFGGWSRATVCGYLNCPRTWPSAPCRAFDYCSTLDLRDVSVQAKMAFSWPVARQALTSDSVATARRNVYAEQACCRCRYGRLAKQTKDIQDFHFKSPFPRSQQLTRAEVSTDERRALKVPHRSLHQERIPIGSHDAACPGSRLCNSWLPEIALWSLRGQGGTRWAALVSGPRTAHEPMTS